MGKNRRYIAVDRRRVMRCSWCGTSESEHWIHGKEGSVDDRSERVYCSKTCELADIDDTYCHALLPPFFWIWGVITIIGDPQDFPLLLDIPTMVMVFSVTFILFVLVPLFWGVNKQKSIDAARQKTPKNSRRADKVFKTKFLYCAKCGGALEIEHGSLQLRCSYCGFVNKVSITPE